MGSPTLPDISIDMKPAARWWPAALFFVVTLSGCSGVQSALDPAGEEAGQVAALFWVMVAGGSIIWLLVCGLMIHALRSRREPYEASSTGRLIFWGGVAFPVVTLVLLLGYALWLMPGLRPFAENGASDALRIEITGKQYWWQVVYHPAGGSPVTSANEVRLPVGVPVEITLNSADVIHSFWIPALGGKMDMIPGRTNRLSLRATKTGTFRGPCAEFCGTSHTMMAFAAVAMEAGAFRQWLAEQTRPSPKATASGAALFVRHGCGACHAVAGTEAGGTVGPDLSHIGSRKTVGAGILSNSAENIARFITEPGRIKPGVQMPSFAMLPPDDVTAIATWLKELE